MHPSLFPSIPTASLHPPSCPLFLWMLQVLQFKARGGKRLEEGKTEVGGGGVGQAVPSGKEGGTYSDGKRRGSAI